MQQNQITNELQEYMDFGYDMKETLESEHGLAMYNKDYATAYDLLGKMMAYKLIEADDFKLSKAEMKLYEAAGIESTHRFKYDYRRTMEYIPEWLYTHLEHSGVFQVNILEHWGKRIEGNYSGDVVIKSYPMDLRITRCTTSKKVDTEFSSLEQTVGKETGKKFRNTQMRELCKKGVYRLFTISVDGNCVNAYKSIGFVMLQMKESGLEGTLILNTESIIGNWLPITSTIEAIKKAMYEMGCQDCTYKIVANLVQARNTQKGLMEKSNALSISREKRLSEQA